MALTSSSYENHDLELPSPPGSDGECKTSLPDPLLIGAEDGVLKKDESGQSYKQRLIDLMARNWQRFNFFLCSLEAWE